MLRNSSRSSARYPEPPTDPITNPCDGERRNNTIGPMNRIDEMSLDPQIQPIVDAVNAAAADAPPLAEQTIADRREGYLALSALAGPGPDLDHITDSSVEGIPIRTYANKGANGIFVYIHGGGYTIGDLDSHDPVCRQLAVESGATVVAVDYRLAPEHPFPAGIEDSWTVLQWIDAHRSDFAATGDAGANKIVIGGDSAGGNFAAVLALMARDADLDLAAQLLVYPAVDAADASPSMTENGVGYVLTAETMEWFGDQYAADVTDWRASPLLATSHTDVAPALIITAEFDPLRDQGMAYADKLRDAGVSVEHTNYEGVVHVFFQLGPIVDAGARAVTQVAIAAETALA